MTAGSHVQGQAHHERGAVRQVRLDRDRAAVADDRQLAEGQAEPAAGALALSFFSATMTEGIIKQRHDAAIRAG